MEHVLGSKDLTWTNVQSPGSEELVKFIRQSGLRPPDGEFVADRHHRPEIAVRSDYLLLLVHVPVFDRQTRVTSGVPLFFVIKDQQLFSLHYEPLVMLDKIRQELEISPAKQEAAFKEGPLSLCLVLLSGLNEASWHKTERLSKHIDIAEDAVFQGNERKMVEEISLLTRDLMDFRKVVRPHNRLLASPPRHSLATPAAQARWQRVHSQHQKLWENLESMFESVRELGNANSTMLQHKENELLRLLTIYSIVAIPMLVLVDPFFAPRAADATVIDRVAFWLVIGALAAILLFVLGKARRRNLM